jgi:hypothetical protein
MKKAFLLLMAVAAVSTFAQENWDSGRRKAVTFNPSPFILGSMYGGFGGGGGFEYAFIPQISGKSQLYFVIFDPSRMSSQITGDPYVSSLRFTLEGRWYPMEKSVHGLFANCGLQFQQLFGKFNLNEYEWIYDDVTETGHDYLKPVVKFDNNGTFGIYTGLGYKFIFGKSRTGLVLEPTLDYIWSANFGSFLAKLDSLSNLYWELGIQGVRFTVHIGASF